MKDFILWSCLMILLGDGSCQTSSSQYEKFVSSFSEISLPLNVSEAIREINLNEERKAINFSDYQKFLKLGNDAEWKYKPEYSYKSLFKFNCGEYLALVYQRAHYSENILEEKSEYILNIYSKSKLISSKMIQGSYGDDIAYFCQITQDYKLVLTKESYQIDNATGESIVSASTKNYVVNIKTGMIVPY